MLLASWNVNGLRAAMDKGLRDFVQSTQPDILCLQEIKALPDQVDLEWTSELGYSAHWNPAEKKGYSGTLSLSRIPPTEVATGLEDPAFDGEGRVLRLTFDHFHLVNVYTPNAQRGLKRLPFRQAWDDAFRAFVVSLESSKPVVFCGDLNCAHEEIDLANPKQNRKNAGFTDEERAGLTRLFDAGYVDAFREIHGPVTGRYTWWTYRSDARARNVGWRIDYFGVSEKIWDRVSAAQLLDQVMGSDHCPVTLEMA